MTAAFNGSPLLNVSVAHLYHFTLEWPCISHHRHSLLPHTSPLTITPIFFTFVQLSPPHTLLLFSENPIYHLSSFLQCFIPQILPEWPYNSSYPSMALPWLHSFPLPITSLPHPLLLSLNHLSSKFPIAGISPIQRYLDHETRKRVAVGGGEPDHPTLERQGGGQVRDRE